MKSTIENLLYCPLDMETPPTDFLDHLNNLKLEKLYTDNYRNCYHVPIMYDTIPNKFSWMPFAFPYKSLREWLEDVLFPITGKSRVMIITTPPGVENPPHIDCSKDKFQNTLQHKFRYVLQGNIDDLVFMSKSGDVRCNQGPDTPFVMSGSWPHYMQNRSDTTKFTLALGAPWDGDLRNESYVNLVSNSYKKYKSYYQSFENLQLPENWEDLFEEKYDFRKKADHFLQKKISR